MEAVMPQVIKRSDEIANTVHFYLNDALVSTVKVDTTLLPRPFAFPMHINMVTETYNWEQPPTAEELNDKDRNNIGFAVIT